MTKLEFAPIMGFLQSGCGMREPPSADTVAAYYDLLGDLPAEVVRAAAKQVMLDHVYPTLPPAGLIRKAALALGEREVVPAEAWAMFLAAVRKHGSGPPRRIVSGGEWREVNPVRDGLASLPPRVRRAAQAFGWQALADTPPDGLPFAQDRFLKIYAGIAEQEQQEAIMLPAVRDHIAELAEKLGTDASRQLEPRSK